MEAALENGPVPLADGEEKTPGKNTHKHRTKNLDASWK